MNGADGSVAKNAIKPWDARVDESAVSSSVTQLFRQS